MVETSPGDERLGDDETLRRSEERFRLLAEAIPQLVVHCDRQGNLLACNRRWYEYTGQTPEEAQGLGWMRALHPDDAARLAERERATTWDGELLQTEYRLRRASDGSYRRHLARATPIRAPDGRIVAWLANSTDMDDQAGVEERIRQLATIVDKSPDLVAVVTLDQRMLHLNHTGQVMLGIEGDEAVWATRLEDYLLLDDLPIVRGTVIPTLLREGVWSGEFRFRHFRTGEPIAVFWDLFVVREPRTGEPLNIGIHARDIRPQKAAEEAMKAAETKYRRLYQSMSDALVTVDLDGRIQDCNEAFRKMLGYDAEELRTFSYRDFTPEKWHAAEAALIEKQVLKRGYSDVFEKEYRRKDGTVFPVELKGFLLRDEAGQPCGIWGIVRDITERKRAEEALRESERRLRALIEAAPYGAYEYELQPDGRLLFVGYNEAANRMIGLNHAPFLGKPLEEAFPPLAETPIPAAFCDVAATGKRYEDDHVLYAHDVISGIYEISAFQTAPNRMAVLFRDITERKRAEELVLESQRRLSTLMSNLPGMAYRCRYDAYWTTEFISDGCIPLTGYTPEDFVGNHRVAYADIIHPDDRQSVREKVDWAIAERRHFQFEYRIITASGEEKWIWEQGIAIYSDTGEVEALEGLMTDITERKRAEKELRTYREQLEELVQQRTAELVIARDQAQAARNQADAANRAKSIFLASMSHELRTPLNAVLGFSHLLRSDPMLNSNQKESLDIINRSGEHLLGLINDVLDISTIEAGRVALKETGFDLYGTLDAIQEMMLIRAKAKGLEFLLDRDPALPRYIRTDEKKLRQIIVNLAGNAVKFTQTGKVALRVRGEEEGQLLRFEVEDTGPGILPELLPTLFDAFVQGGHNQEGAGLGLFISQRLVELMGGHITVRSEPGKGSLFSFDIRLKPADGSEIAPRGPYRSVARLASGQPPRRILVAEDKPESRLFLVKTLQSVGFHVVEAENGQEAVNLFEESRPDLVLMDMRMPVMDGYAAIQSIKATQRGRTTPIVAVSASALEVDRQEILATGADDFLSKPMQPSELFEKIHVILGIEYLYTEEVDDKAVGVDQASLTKMLMGLPEELAGQLAQAMDVLDLERFKALLAEVSRHAPLLAEKLRRLVDDCELTKLTKLLATRSSSGAVVENDSVLSELGQPDE